MKSVNEWYIKAAEIIAGKQPKAARIIEDVTEKDIEDFTIGELVDFLEQNREHLQYFWH